jgi:hypothetical protein
MINITQLMLLLLATPFCGATNKIPVFSDIDSTETLPGVVLLNDVYILNSTDRTILRKTAAKLPTKSNHTKSVFLGIGQYTQIIECNEKAIQLSRFYGTYVTKGSKSFTPKRLYNSMSIIPTYNASSYKYDASGTKILDPEYFKSQEKDLKIRKLKSYNSYQKYVFDVMGFLYAFGPLYSSNIKDYNYEYEGGNGRFYTYSFESSDRYPKNNPMYAKGKIVIDVETFTLKSIHVDNIGCHNLIIYLPSNLSNNDPENKRQDCVDCSFSIDKHGEICYALIHIPWNKNIYQYFGDYTNSYYPRSYPMNSNCLVTECWKTESCDSYTKKDILREMNALLKNANAVYQKVNDGHQIEKYVINDSVIHIVNKSDINICKYNPQMIKQIDWALDVSVAERQLSKYVPIETQYISRSGESFDVPSSFYSCIDPALNDNQSYADNVKDTVLVDWRNLNTFVDKSRIDTINKLQINTFNSLFPYNGK